MKLLRFIPAGLMAAVATLAIVPAANAAITSTHVATPADPSFTIYDQEAAPPEYTISGTATGATVGEKVDFRCYVSPTESSILKANVPVEVNGTFSATGVKPSSSETCRVLAVPAGTQPTDLSPFTGPVLSTGESEESFTEGDVNEGMLYEFYANGQQLTAAADYDSISGCGIDDGYLHHDVFVSTTTWYCNDWYDESTNGLASSPLRVDGENAYFSVAAKNINEEADGFPELEYSYSQDPANGNLTILDNEEPALCEENNFPPDIEFCEEFHPSGVRVERIIEQSHDGHVIVVTDQFSSIDGKAHQVEAHPENDQYFGGNGNQIEYSFPGGAGYGLHAEGDIVPFASTSPGAIYIRVAGAADGDTATGRGAIVVFQPSSPATFAGTSANASEFYLNNTLTVPATGSATLKYAYVQAFGQSEVEADVAELLGTGPSPTPPSPTPTSTSRTGPTSSVPAAKYKFGIKKIIHVRGGGAAKLRIRYSGPGLIQLSGKNVTGVSRRASAGISYLPVKPDRAAAALLKREGRIHVSVSVEFTPDAGVGRIKDKQVGVWLYS